MENSMSQTWNSQNSGSSSSSERYKLDMNDRSNIVVYKYRTGQQHPEITSQADLARFLDNPPKNASALSFASKDTSSTAKSDSTSSSEPRYRCSRKAIPRGTSRIDVRMEDLFTEEERGKYAKYPSSKNSLASVGLPRSVWWKRLLFNSYPDLYIVSPISTPNSSVNNSPEQSQHVSPTSTFPKEPTHNPGDV